MAFTHFRGLRTSVHHWPPVSVTSTDKVPAVVGERPRTGVNETKTEPGAGVRISRAGGAGLYLMSVRAVPDEREGRTGAEPEISLARL